MALAVRVALNPNTTNQPCRKGLFKKHVEKGENAGYLHFAFTSIFNKVFDPIKDQIYHFRHTKSSSSLLGFILDESKISSFCCLPLLCLPVLKYADCPGSTQYQEILSFSNQEKGSLKKNLEEKKQ